MSEVIAAAHVGAPVRARRRSSLLLKLVVLALGSVLIGACLVLAATGARAGTGTPVLSATFAEAPRGADVVDVRPAPVALPAEPSRPIDVPRNPYAPEPVVEIGRVSIPKLGVDQRLMRGVTLNNIDQGPSHWPGSAHPGQVGNTVIAGHRVTHSKPFRNIDRLVAGDEIVVTARGMRATYLVRETFVVTPQQMEIVDPTDTPVLTIFACHPPGSARQRIVVRGDLSATERV